MIKVIVDQVGVDVETSQAVVLLRDPKSNRILPIWVGPLEATAIAMQLEQISPTRPMTHDLMVKFLEELGCTVQRILIDDLKDHTFYAQITCAMDGESREFDSRPSDAIALALRTEAPIYVSEQLLASATVEDVEGGKTLH